jgi:peptidoglycan/xylan/chitin deacetylase (PgdA/CDA1 family)
MQPAHGIMFHHFRDHRHPDGQGALDAGQFDAMLNYLGIERFLTAQDWVDRVRADALKPGDLCLSFDDALRCQYDVALPVMRHYGLTAFWFVYSSVFQGGREPLEVFRYFRSVAFDGIDAFYDAFDAAAAESPYAAAIQAADAATDYTRHLAEHSMYSTRDRRFRYLRDRVLGAESYNALMWLLIDRLGWRERIPYDLLWQDDACLRQLDASGHVIGLHSYSHPTDLKALPVADQRREYARNFDHLTSCLGKPVKVMSHPCNSYSDQTLAILRDLGIDIGFRSNMSKLDGSHLELPRKDHALVSADMLQRKLD